jgi:hypothetical protein
VQIIWKALWRFLKRKPKKRPTIGSCNPEIPHLGIYQKECVPGYDRAICTPMFIAALFTTVNLWKQLRCPTTDEWIKKTWYVYTIEYYSAIQKNKIILFTGKWVDWRTSS